MIIAAVLVSACGGPRATVPPPSTPSPAEVEVVARANVILSLQWSPNQRTLAVLRAEGRDGTGRLDLLDPSGSRRTSLSAEAAAWIDDERLLTLEIPSGGSSIGTMVARIHDVASSATTDLPGAYAALLGNGHGSVALVIAPTAGASGEPLFDLWSNGRAERPPVTGTPVAWSSDGTMLALLIRPTTVLTATGGAEPARVVVVRMSDWTRVFDSVDERVDARLPLWFAPDGSRLAATAARGGAIVFGLDDGRITRDNGFRPYGWSPDGSLVLVSDTMENRLMDLSGEAIRPDLPDGFPVYGPAGATLVLQPSETFGQGRALIGRNGVWRVVLSLAAGEGTPLAWSPDGTACFVATGTTDAQQVLDRLLRVIVPG